MIEFEIWHCGLCGADGVGDGRKLQEHVDSHPAVRFWIGRRLLVMADRKAGFRLMRAKP